ncbi:MAG: hypothetical protein AAF642_01755 [Pseudomonadota bacterium]
MTDRNLNLLAIILAIGALYWMATNGNRSSIHDSEPPEPTRVQTALSEFSQTDAGKILTKGDPDELLDLVETDPTRARAVLDDTEKFLENASGRPGHFDNQDYEANGREIISFTRSATQRGWDRMIEANGRDKAAARSCLTSFESGFIQLSNFNLQRENLRPDWLYVEQVEGPVRLAAMAHMPSNLISDTDFVLFRLSDCQLMQTVGEYPTTRIPYTVPGHDRWLTEHFRSTQFIVPVKADASSRYDIYIHPVRNLVRTVSITVTPTAGSVEARVVSSNSKECVRNLIDEANSPRTRQTNRFSIVATLPDPNCFSLPALQGEHFSLSMSELPLVIHKSESIADMKRRIRRDRPNLDDIVSSSLRHHRYGTAQSVPELSKRIDPSRVEILN